MAKPTTIKIKLVSTADTGFFYVTKKNPRNMTEKMSQRKYDPVARKHVEFKEAKNKRCTFPRGTAARSENASPPQRRGSRRSRRAAVAPPLLYMLPILR